MSNPSFLVLGVLDGWGISPQIEGNAIKAAKMPNIQKLYQEYPFGILEAAGMAVGVSWGEVGNSEVGHLGLGAGMVVYQNLPRIQMSIEDKSFFDNTEFIAAIDHANKHNGTVHLLGLASSGGVHAHIEHLEALLAVCKKHKARAVAIHMITDGRDTAPRIAKQFVEQVNAAIKQQGCGTIATIAGRYWSMDRNNNWDRIEKAYNAMTEGKGEQSDDPLKAIDASYVNDKGDEELVPTVIVHDGQPVAVVKEGDALIFFNFREDRARELTKAFVDPEFQGFKRHQVIKNLYVVTFVEYEKGLPVHVAFPPLTIAEPLGKVIAEMGKKQLRVAETEKYAHVTYFFNGGQEEPFRGEERKLVASKKVESYATCPEMSAHEIVKEVIAAIDSQQYFFILFNIANPDMVGHTGDFSATVKAMEVVDECIGKIVDTVLKHAGVMALTADHGNAEQKIDPLTNKPAKEHTANPIPFIVIDPRRSRHKDEQEVDALVNEPSPIGVIADVAPTVLDLMGITPPREMTGRSLLKDLF